MGLTINKGTIPFDRNIARIELFTDGEVRDDWRIVIHFQDALYDGNVRVIDPQFGTERIDYRYGDIKDMDMPGGGKVSDLFTPIRGLGYALRQHKADEAAAAAEGRAKVEEQRVAAEAASAKAA